MTANEKLQDEAITHALYLQGYSKGTATKVLNLLKRTHNDLVQQLGVALERLPQGEYNVARIDALLTSINGLIRSAYGEVSTELDNQLRGLATYETGYQTQLFQSVLPEQIAFIAVTGEQAYAVAMARPFQGRLLKDWMEGLDTDLRVKVRDAVRMGILEGQTTNEIVRKIRGTKALNYADGLLDINRRNAETIVRTAIAHTAAYARDLTYEANDDVIKGVIYTATLDSSTSILCASRDRNFYAIGKSRPAIPAHMNCRSVYTAALKSWRELGLDIPEVPESTRSSFSGQIPAKVTYNEFLRKQSAEFQDEVLGSTKGKLFREGGLDIQRFISKQGKEYTLDELRQRDASAFKQAGL